MRLKKRKVTIVERGRLVHQTWRGILPQLQATRDVLWTTGHVSASSRRGQALLAAEALR